MQTLSQVETTLLLLLLPHVIYAQVHLRKKKKGAKRRLTVKFDRYERKGGNAIDESKLEASQIPMPVTRCKT